jgi:hypothetical protein
VENPSRETQKGGKRGEKKRRKKEGKARMKSSHVPEAVEVFADLRHRFNIPAALALIGEPGCGKTSGVVEGARRAGLHPVVLRGHSLTELHAVGYPAVLDSGVDFVPPQEFRSLDAIKREQGLLVFIDEVNTSSSIVRAQLLQLLEQGRVHCYDFNGRFPAVVVCAMNSSVDAGVVDLPRNVRSRMLFVEVERPPLAEIVHARLQGGFVSSPARRFEYSEALLQERLQKVLHLIEVAEQKLQEERDDHYAPNPRLFIEVGLRLLGYAGVSSEVLGALLQGSTTPELGIDLLRAVATARLEDIEDKVPFEVRRTVEALSPQDTIDLFEEFVTCDVRRNPDIRILIGFLCVKKQVESGDRTNIPRFLDKFEEVRRLHVGLRYLDRQELEMLNRWYKELRYGK